MKSLVKCMGTRAIYTKRAFILFKYDILRVWHGFANSNIATCKLCFVALLWQDHPKMYAYCRKSCMFHNQLCIARVVSTAPIIRWLLHGCLFNAYESCSIAILSESMSKIIGFHISSISMHGEIKVGPPAYMRSRMTKMYKYQS